MTVVDGFVLGGVVLVSAWLLAMRPGSPARSARRLRGLARTAGPRTTGPAGRSTASSGVDGPRTDRSGATTDGLAVRTRALGAAGAAVLCVVVLDAGGLVVAPFGAGGAWWVLGRLEPAAVRRRRVAVAHGLPAAADLLLACVAAGAPPADALAVVGEAVEGVVGDELVRAATAHALGTPFADVAAAWQADPVTAPLAAVGDPLARSEDSGAPLARALRQVADDLP